MAAEVQALRDFRDRHLLTSGPGRALVRAYYHRSPPVAAFLWRHPAARTATRWLLTPVVAAVRHPPAALGLTLLLVAALGLRALRRRRAAGRAP